MFGEKTGCNHANAIVHVSGGIQFTHARIYQRITRFSFTPQPEMLFVVFPLDAVVFGFKSLCNRLRKIENDHLIETAPDQFIEEFFSGILRQTYQFTDRYGPEPEM